MPHKAQLYERETYFREGLRECLSVFGGRAVEILQRSAVLLVKPDGIAAGKVGFTCDFLAKNGFRVIGAFCPTFSRLLWREMWRYQLTAATLDRLAVNDIVLQGHGLLLLLADEAPSRGLPGTVRLAGLKGSADLSQQVPGTLRSLLDQPSRVLSFIHVADEPADVVRELGLLLERDERIDALRALLTTRRQFTGRAELDQILRAEPARRPFDVGRSFDTVRAALLAAAAAAHAAGRSDAAARCSWAASQLDLARDGALLDWLPVASVLADSGAELDRWDVATVAGSSIRCDDPGAAKAIGNPSPELWSAP